MYMNMAAPIALLTSVALAAERWWPDECDDRCEPPIVSFEKIFYFSIIKLFASN